MIRHLKSILVLIVAMSIVAGSCICVNAVEPIDKIVFHVAPYGSDAGSGTEAEPFATIERAATVIKQINHTGIPVDVIIHGGTYRPTNTIDMSNPPAGGSDANSKVTYKAAGDGEVIVSGFKEIDISKFTKVEDAEMRERFKPDALPYIGVVDLAEQGVERRDVDMFMGEWLASGQVIEWQCMLLNGKEQWIAQWPDYGEYANFNEVVFGGVSGSVANPTFKYYESDFDRWQDPTTGFIRGFMGPVYLEQTSTIESIDKVAKTITMGKQLTGGAKPGRTFRILNIAEELDKPGEYFIDVETMKLYYYPPYKMSASDKLELCVEQDFWIQVEETRHITFENIIFEGFNIAECPTGLINIRNSDNIEVKHCTFQYLQGSMAIRVEGKNNLVEGCGFYNSGANAVWLDGDGYSYEEDFPNLEPLNNRIVNNHFYNTGSQNNGGTAGAVTASVTYWWQTDASVGNVINNNLIHHLYGCMNVTFTNATQWDISYNEIANGMRTLADYGFIYSGARASNLGNTINYNYCHDYVSALDASFATNAIYLDDWLSGQTANNNICIAGGDGATNGLFNVGAYTTFKNNICATGRTGVMMGDRGAKIQSNSTCNNVATGLGDLPAPLAAAYPHMVNVYNKTLELDGLFATMGNYYTGNVSVGCTNSIQEFSREMSTYEHNYEGDDMSIFVDPDNHDWRVKSEVAEELGFDPGVITDKNFDMDKIGIQKDVWDIKNPLEPFRQVYPANGAKSISGENVKLAWEPALFADEYDWVVATDPELKDVVASGTTVFEFADVGDLDLAKNYYWKVTARNITKQIGAEWESEGVPYLFSTATREPVDKTFLKNSIQIATEAFADVKDGTGNVGEFATGTEEKLSTLLAEANHIYSSHVSTQDAVDTAQKSLDDAVSGISSFMNKGWVTVDTSSADNWVAANPNTTVTESDGIVTLTGGNTVAYNKHVGNYNLMKFRYKGEHGNSWTGITLRQLNPAGNVYSGTQYLVCIKKDIFEFQKYLPGAPATGILETAPNNGIVPEGEWCDIEFAAVDVTGGVNVFFKVNGETIFDFYDNDQPVYSSGSFCIKPPAGTVQIAPAEDVPTELYVSDSDMANREKVKLYTHESDECTVEGRWARKSSTKGYNQQGLRMSQGDEPKVTYSIDGKNTEHMMFYYWHDTDETADPNAQLEIEFNYSGDSKNKVIKTIDFTQGEPGWRALGSFPFNEWGGKGTVKMTLTTSGEGALVHPVLRVVEISEEERDFAHLFYMNATNMTALKIGKGFAFCDTAKLNIPDVVPQIINDKTYLPLRFLADAFHYDVAWDGATSTATITSEGKTIQVQPGQNQMTINGQVVPLEATALLVNDRILLPVRDITEALGKTVLWNGDTQIVLIGDNFKIAEDDINIFTLINNQFGGDEHEE